MTWGGPPVDLSVDFENKQSWGSGCGSVGRVVASDTRGPPRSESNHRQILNYQYSVNIIKTTEKEARNRPFFVLKWAIPGLFFLVNTVDSKRTMEILIMTEIEPRTSGIGSDRSTTEPQPLPEKWPNFVP